MRVIRANMLLSMVIPGPKNPKNLDTFLAPVIKELVKLEAGVEVWDAFRERDFTLHTYCPLIASDWIARASLLHTSGPTAISFCDYCSIKGIRAGGTYCPHTAPRTNIPPKARDRLLKRKLKGEPVFDLLSGEKYKYSNPPRQTDQGFRDIADDVAEAIQRNENVDELIFEHGIKGRCAFTRLRAIVFPWSFPPCAMHMLFENICPNLTRMYRGTYFKVKEEEEDDDKTGAKNVPSTKAEGKGNAAKGKKGNKDIGTGRGTNVPLPSQISPSMERKFREWLKTTDVEGHTPDTLVNKEEDDDDVFDENLMNYDIQEHLSGGGGESDDEPMKDKSQTHEEEQVRNVKTIESTAATSATGSCIVLDTPYMKTDYSTSPFLKYVIQNMKTFERRRFKEAVREMERKYREEKEQGMAELSTFEQGACGNSEVDGVLNVGMETMVTEGGDGNNKAKRKKENMKDDSDDEDWSSRVDSDEELPGETKKVCLLFPMSISLTQ